MKVRAIAIAALLSAAVPTAVLAQNSTNSTTDKGVVTQGNVGSGASMTTEPMGAATDFDAFLKGFEKADFTSSTGDMSTATSFNVVRLSGMENADATKLREVLGAHQQNADSVPGWLNTNAQAKRSLEAEGLSAKDVVWAAANSSGVVTFYINDFDAAGAAGAGAMSGGAATKTQ